MRAETRLSGLVLVLAASLLCPTGTDAHAQEELVLTGELEAAEADRLSVPLTDTWRLQLKWLIGEGSRVEAGDVVARFDPGQAEESLAEAEDDLAEKLQERVLSETNLRLAKLDLELAFARAEAELKKIRLDAAVPETLREGTKFRELQRELQTKESTFESARLALVTHEATARATMTSVDLEIGQLRESISRYEENLSRLELRATKPGIVVHKSHPWEGTKFKEGDQVQATWLIASIPDLKSLEVLAWAAEPDIPRLALGQEVALRFDAYPARAFSGRVIRIGQAGESRRLWGKTPYFSVHISIGEIDQEIMKPGMSVRCEIRNVPSGATS